MTPKEVQEFSDAADLFMAPFLADDNNFDYSLKEGQVYANELYVGEMIEISGVPYLKTSKNTLISMGSNHDLGIQMMQPLEKTAGTRIAPGTEFTIIAR